LILIDTTPLVALCDPQDPLHKRALRDLDQVNREPLAVCESVLSEACFLLPHPIQRKRLARLVTDLPITWVTREADNLQGAVFAWLEKYSDHEPDWADGTLVALATQIPGARVWTYDTEFLTTWRTLKGKRVPLFANTTRVRRSKSE